MTPRRLAAAAVAVAGAVVCTACASQHADAVKRYSELACRTSSDESAITAAVHGFIHQVVPQPLVTLRTKHGMRMTVHGR